MGDYMLKKLRKLDSPMIKDVRGLGLFIGVEIDPALSTARDVCETLMHRGILSKETHDTVVRLAPPLTISRSEIDWALDQINTVLAEMDRLRLAS
jgi:ornithine--oxo-acid transaminase